MNAFRTKASSSSSGDTITTFEKSLGIVAIIRANGNVGIGTTAPAEKLEINGNLRLSGPGNITATGTIEGGNLKAKYHDVAEWRRHLALSKQPDQ